MSETTPYVPIITRIQTIIKTNTEDDFPPFDDSIKGLQEIEKMLSELSTELEYRMKEAETRAKVAKEYSRNSIKAYEEGRALVYGEMLDILKGEPNRVKNE